MLHKTDLTRDNLNIYFTLPFAQKIKILGEIVLFVLSNSATQSNELVGTQFM